MPTIRNDTTKIIVKAFGGGLKKTCLKKTPTF